MDFKTLRECAAAYNAVYDQELRQEIEEQQAFENWVNSLVEEGYDLSEYTWEEMYEVYIEDINEAPMTAFQAAGGQAKLDQLNRGRSPRSGRATAAQLERQGQDNLFKAGGGNAAIAKGPTRNQNVRGGGTVKVPTLTRQDIINRGTVAAGTKPTAKPSPTPAAKPAPQPAATKPAPTPAAKPAAAKPAPEAKVGPAPTAKPTPTTSTASAEKPSAMDQWAKANPRLAQAQKIRQQGGSRAEVNKSLYNKGTAAADSTPTVVKAGVDLFDIIQGYLLDEGYAKTLEEAQWMMANLIDEEAIGIILGEALTGERYKKVMKKPGGTAYSRKVSADPAKRATRGGRGGESDFGAGDRGSGNKAARRAGTYQEEEFEIDEALTGDRYKKVMNKPGGTAYSRKVSADPTKRAKRGGRGGESDFGAGDRGSGNKAARRAGTYQEYNVNEAQHARENPEKYEREQSKKYAPVRGERTPMPPRGDKRREDFEKWYAKQMGR